MGGSLLESDTAHGTIFEPFGAYQHNERAGQYVRRRTGECPNRRESGRGELRLQGALEAVRSSGPWKPDSMGISILEVAAGGPRGQGARVHAPYSVYKHSNLGCQPEQSVGKAAEVT